MLIHDFIPEIFNGLTDVILVRDANKQLVFANSSAKIMYADLFDKEAINQNTFNSSKFDEFLMGCQKSKKYYFTEYHVGGSNGEGEYFISIGRLDIEDLIESKAIADAVFSSAQPVLITDANCKILRVNQSVTMLTGYSQEDLVGQHTSIFKSNRHDAAFYQTMWKNLLEKKSWQGAIWDKKKNGEIYPKWLNIKAIVNSEDITTHYVAAFNDLSEHSEAKDMVNRLAFYDPLTNLPNRRFFMDQMKNLLSKETFQQSFNAIFLIDLDHFKAVNDTLGHIEGDKLLVEIASRLKSCVRQRDVVARLGGDEFVVLLEMVGNECAQTKGLIQTICSKIIRTVKKTITISERSIPITVSLGVCIFESNSNKTVEEIIKRADGAMYLVKSSGRNGFEIVTESEDKRALCG